MSLMGLDIGTNGCKATVFNEDGQPLSSHFEEYPLYCEPDGRCELDVETVWNAVSSVIRSSAAGTPKADPVEAIGVSALGDSVTPVDREGKALTRSLTGHLDVRATSQADWLCRHIGRERLFELTGVPVHSMHIVPKMMWFLQNEPDVYEHAWKFVGWPELTHIRLGLDPLLDYSLGCRTVAVNIHNRDWSQEILDRSGLDASKFCLLAPSTEIAGRLDRAHATSLGLKAGVQVVAGGFDQACAALGAGAVLPGSAELGIGTGECVVAVLDRCLLTMPLLNGNHGCGFHVVDGLYMSITDMVTSGALLRWYRDTIGLQEAQLARELDRDVYDVIIEQTPDRPARIFVLPYFSGAGTPWFDPEQRGTIFGVTLDTDRAEIVKGILDGLCFELRLNLESLNQAGLHVNNLKATGGGAKSDRWMQLKADITGLPVEIMQVREAGSLGAAFLAGLGTGVYSSPEDILSISKVKRTLYPNPNVKAQYDEAYGKYCELRSRVEGLHF
jgi:xylulokinase